MGCLENGEIVWMMSSFHLLILVSDISQMKVLDFHDVVSESTVKSA